jgi:hypothetical protein
VAPISVDSAHPLIPVLSYSNLLLIKPDAERQNNWTKVLGDISASFAASCPMYCRPGRTAEVRGAYEKALALTQQEPERQFLQERLGS